MASRRAELSIERLSKLGEGVASLEGRTVFVEGALPGERVVADVEEHAGVLRGQLAELLAPSPARRAGACALAGRCGGCAWLHLAEAAQREAKLEIVLSALEHVGRLSRAELEVRPSVTSPASMGYRRRAVLHPSKGRLALFGRRSHERIAIDRCPALVPALEGLPGALASDIGPILADADEVQLLSSGDQRAAAATLRGQVKASHRQSAERTLRAHKLAGWVLAPKEGRPELIGQPVLRTSAPLRPEVPLFLRPDAFSQANEAGNEALVRAALELLAPTAADAALELYAGNGNFTFALAARVKSVLAVESGQVSLELARKSAAEARLGNVRFVQGDSQRVVQGLIAERRAFEVLLLDPPRTGAKGCADWASRLGVRKVVYVACDPVALARDARALAEAGYRPAVLQLVDMFPQTHHVEAVMSFAKAA